MTKQYRPSGSGTVRNRGTERQPKWEASYFTYMDGKRRQVAKRGFKVKRDAENWLRDELDRSRDGATVLPSKVTVGEYLDRWLEVAKHGLTPSTALNYRSIIDGRLKPHVGGVRLQEIRPDHIATMLDALREPGANRRGSAKARPLSETSLVRTVQVLHTALGAAVKQRQLVHNAADGIVKPKQRRSSSMTVWNAEELGTFLGHASGDRLYPLLRLAAFTGMRRGELLGLRWEHVDLEQGIVTVVAARVKVGTTMVDGMTKTTTGQRRIDIDPGTVAALKSWRTAQKAERLAAGPAWQNTGLVFTREDGSPVHADHLAGRFAKLVKGSGVKRVRFHDLRHTHATLLLKAGVPIKVVSERLGHASPAFTLQVYAHVLPGQQAEAAAAFAELVGS